jgi:hypothetical protein
MAAAIAARAGASRSTVSQELISTSGTKITTPRKNQRFVFFNLAIMA